MGCESKLKSILRSSQVNEFLCTLYGEGYWDDVNGEWLPEEEVRMAREKEMKYIREMNVYTRVHRSECKRLTGKEPIKLRWIDTKKSSGEIRSRLVAKEFKTDIRPELFAATPPLEAMRLLVSMVASSRNNPSDWGNWQEAEWKFTARGAGLPREK